MKLKQWLVIGAGLAGLLAVAAGSRGLKKLEPAEVAACTAQGGTVKVAGRSGTETCALPLPDAGKVCRGDDDCIGACWLDDNDREAKLGTPEKEVTGHCQPTSYGFGCHSFVDNGRWSGSACTD
jgi:hypothetical protein